MHVASSINTVNEQEKQESVRNSNQKRRTTFMHFFSKVSMCKQKSMCFNFADETVVDQYVQNEMSRICFCLRGSLYLSKMSSIRFSKEDLKKPCT